MSNNNLGDLSHALNFYVWTLTFHSKAMACIFDILNSFLNLLFIFVI